MNNNEKNETMEFDFSNEIESPLEVDTSSISESVKAFTGAEDTHSMEEMEYYEDEESVKTEESVQSSFAKDSEGTNPDTEVDSALLNQETKVAMDTSQIIHRKGNSGVIPNLELLPTDSIRIPTDEIAETIVVPERKAVSKAEQENADIKELVRDDETSEEEPYGEEVSEEESAEDAYDEETAEETYDGEPAEEDSYDENSLEEALLTQSLNIEGISPALELEQQVQKSSGVSDDAVRNQKIPQDLGGELKQQEYQIILDALIEYRGSRQEVSEKLGISPRTLRYKIAKMREMGMIIPG